MGLRVTNCTLVTHGLSCVFAQHGRIYSKVRLMAQTHKRYHFASVLKVAKLPCSACQSVHRAGEKPECSVDYGRFQAAKGDAGDCGFSAGIFDAVTSCTAATPWKAACAIGRGYMRRQLESRNRGLMRFLCRSPSHRARLPLSRIELRSSRLVDTLFVLITEDRKPRKAVPGIAFTMQSSRAMDESAQRRIHPQLLEFGR